MNKAEEKEFYNIQRWFFMRFIIGLIYFSFFFYFAGTIGNLDLFQPIILNPLLLFFYVVIASFCYAAFLWDSEMRKFQRRL